MQSAQQEHKPLSIFTKIIYGAGDLGIAGWGTLRQIFYIKFLTDVVGLEPRIASFSVFVGIIWDAINDPLVGLLSDRVNTRWGRRRPFLLFFSIPFGLAFLLMWWAPPWNSQIILAIHMTLAYIISDTLQTLVAVPFYTLTPEMTPDYDERTELTSYRMFFNLLISLVVAAAVPMIEDWALLAGWTSSSTYILIAALFGGIGAIPFLVMFFFVRERHPSPPQETHTLREVVETAWENIPFRFATGLYMLNWMTVDMVSLMLPFYLTYWIAQGNLTAELNLFGSNISQESVILGLMFITAILALPIWNWLSKKTSKRKAYIYGMAFWMVVQTLLIIVRPGQTVFIIILTVLAGISVATAHVLPEAIFPDVIEWEELRTHNRPEGIYYGVKNFSRKLAGAVTSFLALQILGWFDYQAPPPGSSVFQQSDLAISAIRILTGPFGAILLLSSIILAWYYPLTREKHARIRSLLARRDGRE